MDIPRVMITLSDHRAVPVLRRALDVKHMGSSDNILGLPIKSTSPPEVVEEERGRPRSKDDRPGVLHPESGVTVLQAKVAGSELKAITLAQPTGRREVSRGRRLLEGLFGRAEERSASVPPLSWAQDGSLNPII
jgi:hypothetical protein